MGRPPIIDIIRKQKQDRVDFKNWAFDNNLLRVSEIEKQEWHKVVPALAKELDSGFSATQEQRVNLEKKFFAFYTSARCIHQHKSLLARSKEYGNVLEARIGEIEFEKRMIKSKLGDDNSSGNKISFGVGMVGAAASVVGGMAAAGLLALTGPVGIGLIVAGAALFGIGCVVFPFVDKLFFQKARIESYDENRLQEITILEDEIDALESEKELLSSQVSEAQSVVNMESKKNKGLEDSIINALTPKRQISSPERTRLRNKARALVRKVDDFAENSADMSQIYEPKSLTEKRTVREDFGKNPFTPALCESLKRAVDKKAVHEFLDPLKPEHGAKATRTAEHDPSIRGERVARARRG